MALDLTDPCGDLDRGKVNAELDKALAPAKDCPSLNTVEAMRADLVDLLDEVQHHAYSNGFADAGC
jgi:hypothetical protein